METRRRETKRRCGFANVSRLTSRLVSRLSSHVPALILTARLESAPYRAAGRLAPPRLALLYDDDEAFPDDVDAVLFHGDAAFQAVAALLVQHERDVLGLLVPPFSTMSCTRYAKCPAMSNTAPLSMVSFEYSPPKKYCAS